MKDCVKSILTAVGVGPFDDAVLTRSIELAEAHRAKLTIVHIIDGFRKHGPALTNMDAIEQEAILAARDRIEAAATRQTVDISNIDFRVEEGPSALRLVEVAENIRADLIVMGAHQSESIIEKFIGSTTDRVIRASSASVLVVKRPVKQAYTRVAIAVDAHRGSAEVTALVAALFPLARMLLIHVVQISPQFEEAMLRVGSSKAALDAHRDAIVRVRKDFMRELSTVHADRSASATTRVIVGDPARSLIQATRGINVDLIATGPGSTNSIQRAFLGSVSRKVLQNAACDVLICRPASKS